MNQEQRYRLHELSGRLLRFQNELRALNSEAIRIRDAIDVLLIEDKSWWPQAKPWWRFW